MSEENIKIMAVIKPDIRNPFDKLLFWTNFLGSNSAEHTKEITLRAFRNISRAGTLTLIVAAAEIHAVHSMQEIFVREKEINEVEIIAESRSESESVNILPVNFHLKKAAATTVATLKLPRAKIFSITPRKSGEHLLYLVTFSFGGGSSLVAY